MLKNESPRRRRAAEAFRSLDTGSDLARRRVWRRVEERMADERRRSRTRLGWAAGAVVGAVAALTIILPAAVPMLRAWYEPSQQEEQRIALGAAFEALGSQSAADSTSGADTNGLGEFVQYLVTATEAKNGAE